MDYLKELLTTRPKHMTTESDLYVACREVDRLRTQVAHLQSSTGACEAIRLQQENDRLRAELTEAKLAADRMEYVNNDSFLQLERELAEARKDSERLDAITHGWRIGHEVGASGHPDHWYIWTTDWSQPLGEGTSFRAAIDAAHTQSGAPERKEGK